MPSTSNPNFNESTEGLEVAKAFAGQIRGRTVLITGANLKGIGFSTAEAIASQSPAHLILAGRNVSRVKATIAELQSRFPGLDYRPLELDLANQQAVRKAAAAILSWADIPSIDIVINSAGVMNLPERILSDDGIEMHFATNHIGHFLFTCLIMPKLIEAAKGQPKGATRVVNVSSLSPTVAAIRWSDINFDRVNKELPKAEQPPYAMHQAWGVQDPENKSYLPLEGYNQSKVANVLFSIAANERLYAKYGILSLTVHPGVIPDTDLGRNASQETLEAAHETIKAGRYDVKSQKAGAATSLVAALDPILGPGKTENGKENLGVYLIDCQISDKADPRAVSSDEAERLWRLSQELVKETFAW